MKTGYFVISLVLAIFISAFAQDKETELKKIEDALRTECVKIQSVVPCAVGANQNVNKDMAIQNAETDARERVTLSMNSYVEIIGNRIKISTDEESSISDTVITKTKAQARLVNFHVIKENGDWITSKTSGKQVYRAVVLMVLEPKLYEEAQNIASSSPKEFAEFTTNLAEKRQSSTSSEKPKLIDGKLKVILNTGCNLIGFGKICNALF
jgi:hypothetical protein